MNEPSDLIVNFTPTGMVPRKADSPFLPIAVSEIVEEVQQATELGITIAHLHVRTLNGEPSNDPDTYGELFRSIRKFAPELILCVSLSGRTDPSFEARKAPLLLTGDAKPDMGSLTLASLNFPRTASLNAPETIFQLAALMMEQGILPELEIFDLGMANYAKYLVAKGRLVGPCYANLIVGNSSSAQLDPLHIGLLIRDLPDHCAWSLGGIGTTQFPANTLGILLGGGVRVGLEDNLYLDQGRTQLATNTALLRRVLDLAAQFGRHPMPPAQLRQQLALQPGHGKYGRAHVG